MLVDVTPLGVTGKEAEHLLDEIGITVNKNAIPFDQLPAEHGVRASAIGTPAATSRGFGPDEMRDDRPRSSSRRSDAATKPPPGPASRGEVREIVDRFPVPGLPAA